MAQMGLAHRSQHLDNNRRHPWYLPASSPLDSLMALVMALALALVMGMAMAVAEALLGYQQLVAAGHVEPPNSHCTELSNERQPL